MFKAVQFDDTAQERIKEAATKEKRLRLEALLNVDTEIVGIKLRPMTGFDVLQLQYVENKFIVGGIPDETDFTHLIWAVKSKEDKHSDKKLLLKVLDNLNNEDFVMKVFEYVYNSFLELPNVKAGKKHKSYDANPSVWLTPIIDTIASEYGWTYDYIMSSPISRILQIYQYLLKRSIGSKYHIHNPITSKASAAELHKIRNNG